MPVFKCVETQKKWYLLQKIKSRKYIDGFTKRAMRQRERETASFVDPFPSLVILNTSHFLVKFNWESNIFPTHHGCWYSFVAVPSLCWRHQFRCQCIQLFSKNWSNLSFIILYRNVLYLSEVLHCSLAHAKIST